MKIENRKNDSSGNVAVSDIIMEMLKKNNIKYIFGSPGTSELAFVQSASRFGIEYVFALHDSTAVGFADGVARASRCVSVVNLHSTQGLLNAAGFIRVALRDNVPILVIAGIPSTEYDIYEPNHYTKNLEQVLTPITKWGWTVANTKTLKEVLHRGLLAALSPPQGPVFICVPQDLLEKKVSSEEFVGCRNTQMVHCHNTVPNQEKIQQASNALLKAKMPLLFVGYGSQHAGSAIELLSETLAAPIIGESLDRGPQVHNVYSRSSHSLFSGFFEQRDPVFREYIQQADIIFFIGCKASYAKVIGKLPQSSCIVQLVDNYDEIEKYHHVDIALIGNIEISLKLLLDAIGNRAGGEYLISRKKKLIEDIA